MTSLSLKKFKIIFTLKQGHKGQFMWIQTNIKSASIFIAKFSLCSIVMKGQNSHDTASKRYGGRFVVFCLFHMTDAPAVHLLEITVITLDNPVHSLHIVGIYRSKVKNSKLIDALK